MSESERINKCKLTPVGFSLYVRYYNSTTKYNRNIVWQRLKAN